MSLPRSQTSRWCVGGRCWPKPQTRQDESCVWSSPSRRHIGRSGRSAGVTVPDHRRNSREQAYVPAEQPPPPQGARIPAAHAHPRGPLDPVCTSSQGPQEPRRLSPGSTGPVPSRPCSRRSIASPGATTCAGFRAPGAAAGAPRWWFTCSHPTLRPGPRPSRPAWASWSAVPSVGRSYATGSYADSATCVVTASRSCRPEVRSSCAPSRRRRMRRTRNSVPTSTVVSNGPCSLVGGSTARGRGR
jgi:hypothetical protein